MCKGLADGDSRILSRCRGMLDVVVPAGAAYVGFQRADPPAPRAAVDSGGGQEQNGEAWAFGGAVGGCTRDPEGGRSGHKRSAAWAELNMLQEARVSANADWVFARKPGSDGLEGLPSGGADKRRKPAKSWGISLYVPAETPPVEVRVCSSYCLGKVPAHSREGDHGRRCFEPPVLFEPPRAQTCIALCRCVQSVPLHCSVSGRPVAEYRGFRTSPEIDSMA